MAHLVPGTRVPVREAAAVAALTAVAAALRLWRLGDLPPGLHVDEAFNLLDVREVLAGARPVFLPSNGGREVLLTYLQAPIVAALGESAAAARLPAAVVGSLLVPALWALVRSLPLPRAPRVALLASALAAGLYWHLHFSRFGIRAGLFPTVCTLALLAWWRVAEAPEDPDRPPGAPSGGGGHRLLAGAALAVLLALAAHTHPAGRGLVLVPAGHAAWAWWRRRDARPARALAAAGAVALALCLPLLAYWWQHPWAVTGHAGEVQVVGRGPEAMVTNAARVAGMFHVAGDPEPWRNLTGNRLPARLAIAAGAMPDGSLARALRGRPVFDVATGVAFLVGLAVAIGALRRGAGWAVLSLLWLVLLLAPSVVTDAAPNFSRAIGAVPVACLLAALGIDRLAEAVGVRRAATVVLLAWPLLAGTLSARDYFGAWAAAPTTPLAFDADKVALARYVDARRDEGVTVYLAPTLADHPTVRLLASAAPRGFDPACGLVMPDGGAARAEYVWPPGDPAWTALESYAGRPLVVEPLEARAAFRDGWPAGTSTVAGGFAVGRIPGDTAPGVPAGEPLAEFGDHARLLRDPVVVASADTSVLLLWQAVGPTAGEYSALVHLVGDDGSDLGNGDGAPLCGTYPTTAWRTGERILDRHVVRGGALAPGTRLTLLVGLYDWRTDRRLPGRLLSDAAALQQSGTVVALPLEAR